jgi:hypothetical protein
MTGGRGSRDKGAHAVGGACDLFPLKSRGGRDRQYGRMKCPRTGRMRPSHVVAWEKVNGPLPDGMQVDHLCGNPLCWNPEHLEAVTAVENVRRSLTTRLTLALVTELRQEHAALPRSSGGVRALKGTRAALAARFGISPRHLADVVKGEKWAG